MDQVGICWFDDPSDAGDAWISINGSASEKISGIEKLSSNILWVTNLHWGAYKKLEMLKSTHIFHTQFFRTSLQLLLEDVGNPDNIPSFIENASIILTRVVLMGEELLNLKLNTNPYRYTTLISDKYLPRKCRLKPMGDSQPKLMDVFKQATQENQAKFGESPKGSTCKKFYYPRVEYANWILSQDYPVSNSWEKIDKKYTNKMFGVEDNALIGATKTNREKLLRLGQKKAAILKISVLSQEAGHTRFSGFSQGVNRYNRGWATLPEVLEISRYSKVLVEDGYTSELGKISIPSELDIGASQFSISKGIFLENYWIGLASALDSGRYCTALGAYIRAYDRIACGRAAEQFHQNSFVVGSYSIGRLAVYLRPSQHESAVELAKELGLAPPLSMMNPEN